MTSDDRIEVFTASDGEAAIRYAQVEIAVALTLLRLVDEKWNDFIEADDIDQMAPVVGMIRAFLAEIDNA